MASIIATLTALPGHENALEEILRVLVQGTGTEPGAITYDLLCPEDAPSSRVVYEHYRDADSRLSHLGSPHLAKALQDAKPHLACEAEVRLLNPVAGIRHQWITVEGRSAELVQLPLGPATLVYLRTGKGILACGAIDPAALEPLGIAVARVRPGQSPSIRNLDDLLSGTVREANARAAALGIQVGMSGRSALSLL